MRRYRTLQTVSDLVPVRTELEAFYVLVAARCGLRMHLLDSVQLLQDSSLANQFPPPQ